MSSHSATVSAHLEAPSIQAGLACEPSPTVPERPVALTDIRVPIFAVGTVRNHVAPWRSSYKIHLLTDCEVTYLLTTGGHNAGIVRSPATTDDPFKSRRRGRMITISTRMPSWRLLCARTDHGGRSGWPGSAPAPVHPLPRPRWVPQRQAILRSAMRRRPMCWRNNRRYNRIGHDAVSEQCRPAGVREASSP